MIRMYRAGFALSLATLLGGCIVAGDGDGPTSLLAFGKDEVTIRANSEPAAVVTAAGELHIDGKPVALSGPQQALVKRYHAHARELRSDGLAVGSAGIAIAGKAVGSAIGGLFGGDTDRIEAEVEAEAARIEAKVAMLCDHLDEFQSTQDALAASLPAFRPYARIDASDCRHEG